MAHAPVPNTGVYPVDPTTLAGKVRLLVGDTDPTVHPEHDGNPAEYEYAWYSDTELEALGTLNSDSPKRTAIWVLSQVAINQALLLRKWTSEDLQVDGPAIAAGIEKTLARLSREVDMEERDDDAFFELYPHKPDYAPFWFGGTGWA